MDLLFKTFLIVYNLLSTTNLYSLQENTTSNPSDTLYQEIMKMDSLLFKVAFNQCDIALYQKIISKDLEFYDDRTGLNTSTEKDLAAFKDKCSKPFALTRQLMYSKVSILGDFGALQQGAHTFHVDGKKVEKAEFITIWESTPDGWKVKRAISYAQESIE